MDIVDPQKNDNDDFQQNNLILQHARLTIVRDSPFIAKVTRASGRVVELGFQRVMLLQKRRIFIYFM